MYHPDRYVLLLFLLESFLFRTLCRCFRHVLLDTGFLLVGHSAAARTLPCSSVRVRALAPDRKTPAVPQAAIRTHFDEPLHVHRDLLAEIAFDCALVFEE